MTPERAWELGEPLAKVDYRSADYDIAKSFLLANQSKNDPYIATRLASLLSELSRENQAIINKLHRRAQDAEGLVAKTQNHFEGVIRDCLNKVEFLTRQREWLENRHEQMERQRDIYEAKFIQATNQLNTIKASFWSKVRLCLS